jgi:predicted phage baseplate assembly protein
VREDLQGSSWVQFGDGLTGRRLPSGIENVIAKYRSGTGAFGGLKPETTVQAGARLDHLDKVFLPDIATGGEAPESGDIARQAAPGKVQSLDRLVSLRDFETETLAIAGVSKVKAAWSLVDNIPSVVVTVLMETGRAQEIDQVRQILMTYNRCRGPQRYPIQVVEGKRLYVWIGADVAFAPTFQVDLVTQAIQQALGAALPLAVGQSPSSLPPSKGLFGIGQRAFGEPEYATRLAGTIQNVPGVQWTQIRQLFALGEADDPATLVPVPRRFRLFRASAVLPCDPRHVLSLYVTHLQLNAVAMPAAEVC